MQTELLLVVMLKALAELAGMFLLVDLAGFAVPVAGPAVTISLTAFNFIAIRWPLRA